ncbi:hypothetical protein EV1_027042 [Malus domestica]
MLSKLPTNVPPHLSLRFLKIFCNSGDLQRARHVFDQIPEPDLRAWTMLMSYQATRDMGSSIAKACAALGDVRNIKELHNEVIRFGFHSDVSLGNAMVDMMPRQGLEAFREMGLNGDWSETQCSNSFFNPTCLLGVERFEFGKSDSWVCGQTWNGR